jgi:hypothetical protein
MGRATDEFRPATPSNQLNGTNGGDASSLAARDVPRIARERREDRMNVLHSDPELQLLQWRLGERALRARLERGRRLGPRPSAIAQLGAAALRSLGSLLIRCGQWLREAPDAASALDIARRARPTG